MHTKLQDIFHDIYQKTQQNKTPNRTLTEHYQLIQNPQLIRFSLQLFFLKESLIFAWNAFKFKADFKKSDILGINIMR